MVFSAMDDAVAGAEQVAGMAAGIQPFEQPAEGTLMVQRARRQRAGQVALIVARGKGGGGADTGNHAVHRPLQRLCVAENGKFDA